MNTNTETTHNTGNRKNGYAPRSIIVEDHNTSRHWNTVLGSLGSVCSKHASVQMKSHETSKK